MTLPGDTLVIGPDGHQAFGPPTITQSGEPDQGANSDFNVYATAPILSGDYKLAFLGFTTAAIDGTAGTMTDIADAMNAAYGDTIARSLPGSETKVPNDNYGAVQFIGALAAQAVATPTLVDDTTDGGIALFDDGTGYAPSPVANVGSFLLDISAFVGYQFTGPRVDPAADPSSANCWQRVWYAQNLMSPNGLVSVTVSDGSASITAYSDSTQVESGSINLNMESLGASGNAVKISLSGSTQLVIMGLPTSAAGLSVGMVWNNGGVLTIV